MNRGDTSPAATSARVDIARGVVSGMAFLHSHGYIHCDLKPANVLLAFDGARFVAKVRVRAGFGRRAGMCVSVVGGGMTLGSRGGCFVFASKLFFCRSLCLFGMRFHRMGGTVPRCRGNHRPAGLSAYTPSRAQPHSQPAYVQLCVESYGCRVPFHAARAHCGAITHPASAMQ